MRVERTTLLCFDASCLIAAAGSPQGGSSLLLDLCRQGWLRAAVSHGVLLEAERNIAAKRGTVVLERYHYLLAHIPWVLAPVPADPAHATWTVSVNAKDQHVVVATLAINAAYLLTLDRRLIAEIQQAALPFLALIPGDFIKDVLPLHPDLPEST
jgi:predicted nucleic acid-binding protein